MFDHPEYDDHEQVRLVTDEATGLRAVIALHSTALGPAAGGCRLWRYPRSDDALRDALRLSRGMSYKNALADLPLGGGKAVILGPVAATGRAALFRAFGEEVEAMGGRYVTAEDVGVSVADMVEVAAGTRYVAGLPAGASGVGGDPSPYTARSVLRGIEVVAAHHLGRSDLEGLAVAIQGVGHVGGELARLLAARGARLQLADTDAARAAALAEDLGAENVAADRILQARADILAPCALGGVITEGIVPHLRARAIVGAANNQLATPETASRLAAAGIAFAPDYLVNAGGIIAVAAEYLGGRDCDQILGAVDAVGPRLHDLLARAAREGESPARLADRMAREKIAAARPPS